MSHPNKIKGTRIENEIAEDFKKEGFDAERVPMSGMMGSKKRPDLKGDIRLQWDSETLLCESKARKGGAGFTVIERWLEGNDILFLKRPYKERLCVMSWSTMIKLMKGGFNEE